MRALVTTWLLVAKRDDVWEVLQDAQAWPQWWRGVESVTEIDPGDARRVGSRYRCTWRGRIPYPVRFDFAVEEVTPPTLMTGRARGDLEGTGVWRLFEGGGVTAVVYQWDVHASNGWLRAGATLARPLVEHNHDWVMRNGGEGLARRLGARLLAGA